MDTVMDGEAADTGLQVLRLKASTTGYIKAADTGLQVLRLKSSTTGYIKDSLQRTEIHHGYGYGWRG
ncbi:hypothetical protein J6590_064076 [Homalodisca vitripennis]|nr:hypothetical protein J6590_064076 [Homalodisca vitripennis]